MPFDQLREQLWHRRLDVRVRALNSIAQIFGSQQTPLYVELLFDARFRQKIDVMRVIADVADARAVGAVVRYTHENLPKLRARRRNPLRRKAADETLALVALYLARYVNDDPEIRSVIREVAAVSPHAAHEILPKIA